MPDPNLDSSRTTTSLTQAREAIECIAARTGTIERMAAAIIRALRLGNKLLTAGNGGSAAEALHMAEELMGRFSRQRSPLAALCLSADPTALTCIANDYGYDEVFARQVQALARPADVLLVLSTSGKSPNLVRALERARTLGLRTLGLLGPAGSAAEKLCEIALVLDGLPPARVQEMHLLAIHLMLEHIDAEFN